MKKLTGVVVAGLATWAFVGIRYTDPEAVYQFYGVFLIIMFTGRFLLEYTKVDPAEFTGGWPVTMGQLLSVPFVLLGIWLLWKKVDFKQAKTA